MGIKKGVATTLSVLSAMGGMAPLAGANDTQKQVNQKSGSSISVLSDIRFGLECLAIGAIFMKIYDNSISSKERLFTPEAQEVYKAIEELRTYVIQNPNLLDVLENSSYDNYRLCNNDSQLINLTNEIIKKFNILTRKISTRFGKSYEKIERLIGGEKSLIDYNNSECDSPFDYLGELQFSLNAVIDDATEIEVIKQNKKNPILHDLLILRYFFGLIDKVEFYKTQNQ